MNVITFASRKGGVGKSTLTAHVAAFAHLSGHRCLIIDADPQGSLTLWHSKRTNGNLPLQSAARGIDRLIGSAQIACVDWVLSSSRCVRDFLISPPSRRRSRRPVRRTSRTRWCSILPPSNGSKRKRPRLHCRAPNSTGCRYRCGPAKSANAPRSWVRLPQDRAWENSMVIPTARRRSPGCGPPSNVRSRP
jgi:hypothetical protein